MKLINKKGFTLIELLAVIIILAVIALIIVPVVLNMMEKSKKGALEASAHGIISAAKYYYADQLLENENRYTGQKTFRFVNGVNEDKLAFKGEIPESGYVTINNKGKIRLDITNGKWRITKSFTNKNIKIELDIPKPVMQSWPKDSTTDFHNATYRPNIVSVEIVDDIIVPANAVASWDVSKDKDGSVMAWVITNSIYSSKYDLYIGGQGGVAANPNSSYLFYNFLGIKSMNLDLLDTKKVTNMSYMFRFCSGLTSLDVSNFDTSNVTTMGWMFMECSSLTSLDLSSFNTGNVTLMGSMFYNCNSLTTLDLSDFDTSKVTGMYYMFYNCSNLTSLDLSNFDTSNTNDMFLMFYNCNNLITLDLSSFNINEVTNMNYMFYICSSLTSLDIRNFNFTSVTAYSDIFTSMKSTGVNVWVKDINAQDWILNLDSTNRPSAWTEANVKISS